MLSPSIVQGGFGAFLIPPLLLLLTASRKSEKQNGGVQNLVFSFIEWQQEQRLLV